MIWIIQLGLSSQVSLGRVNLTELSRTDEFPGSRRLGKEQQGLFQICSQEQGHRPTPLTERIRKLVPKGPDGVF